jgi:hypothetical protein
MELNFAIGDLVRPLNETGEGYVTGFERGGLVRISLNGFEMPFLAKHLVLVRRSETKQYTENEVSTPGKNHLAPDSIHLIFSFEEIINSTARVGMYWVNNYDSTIFAVLYAMEGKTYRLLSEERLTAKATKKITSDTLDRITTFDRLYFQVMFIAQHGDAVPQPFTGYVRHNTPALIHFTNWPLQQTTAQRGYALRLMGNSTPITVNVPAKKPMIQSAPQRLLTERDGSFEIDLHIEELLDDTSGMEKSAIIQHQLSVFERCIDEARMLRLWKFVAIHGVGKGVLRDEVRKLILREGLNFQDASYQRYGYGATEVLMRF